MSKLCKRKFAKARNVRIFEGKVLSARLVANTVIFYIACKLKDDRKNNLIV